MLLHVQQRIQFVASKKGVYNRSTIFLLAAGHSAKAKISHLWKTNYSLIQRYSSAYFLIHMYKHVLCVRLAKWFAIVLEFYKPFELCSILCAAVKLLAQPPQATVYIAMLW